MTAPPSVTCPRCQRTSYNVNDIRERYCGACHRYHTDVEMCACGRPLHYTNPENEAKVREIIAGKGELIACGMLDGDHVVMVPRHYIALHGLVAADLDDLAVLYGWSIQ